MAVINGNEYPIKIDLKVLKTMKKEHGINFFALEKNDVDPDVMCLLLKLGVERSGGEITDEELDNMTLSEIQAADKEIQGKVDKLKGRKNG